MYKYKRNFKKYIDLWAHEWRAIYVYIEENNLDEIADIIKNKEMSPTPYIPVTNQVKKPIENQQPAASQVQAVAKDSDGDNDGSVGKNIDVRV